MSKLKKHMALIMSVFMAFVLIGCDLDITNSENTGTASLTESANEVDASGDDYINSDSAASNTTSAKSPNLQAAANGADKFTVTFKLDKNTIYKTFTVKKGETLDWFEEPTKSGYVFECWKKADNTEFSLFEPITKNTTVTASYSRVYYVYYLNEDGTEFYAEPVREGQAALFIGYPSSYIKNNAYYDFERWVTVKGGSKEANLKNITADIKVYAKFKRTAMPTLSNTVDFILNVPAGRDVRILQITDTQILDASQKRYQERISSSAAETDTTLYNKCFKYIEAAVKNSNPDLILLTGDIVYGEFDDSGRMFQKVIAYMDSLGIPWAPVFGNHDNESIKGVTWQCEQLKKAKNCLFKRGDLTGNGNYTIGIMQGGKMVKAIYMLDSNGCRNAYSYSYNPSFGSYNSSEKVKTSSGFDKSQLDWLDKSSKTIDAVAGYKVSKFIAFHIPIAEFAYGAYTSGYQNSQDLSNSQTYTIGTDVSAKNGDFGSKGEAFKGAFKAGSLWNILKENNFDGVFVGHAHKNNVSILYDGIRLTFGLKTGKYDRYASDQLGGTLITVNEGGKTFKAQHIYVD